MEVPTGQFDFAANPKSKKMEVPFENSHNEKMASFPSNSFQKAGSHLLKVQVHHPCCPTPKMGEKTNPVLQQTFILE